MSEFGLYGVFPFDFGGDDSIEEQEHLALLDALSPGWDSSEDTANYAECFAYAQAVSMIWAINARLKNQAIPERMLENLVISEEACNLRPTLDDLDIERRKKVAAKFRGISGNTLGDIFDALAKLLGVNFGGITLVDPVDIIVFWPGVNPGPPGLEWSSNRLIIGVKINQQGLSLNDYVEKRASVSELLDGMLPAWMSYTIGVSNEPSPGFGSQWIVNQGIVGITLI